MVGIRSDEVRLMRLPAEVDGDSLRQMVSALEQLPGPTPDRKVLPVVLVCDADQGDIDEQALDCARRLLRLRNNGFRLLTLVGRCAPPAAMMMFACGRRRVMHYDARLGFREVQWKETTDRVSSLRNTAKILSGQIGAFCDRQAGMPTHHIPMTAPNQGELLLRAAEESRLRTEQARIRRLERIEQAKQLLAELEPRQEEFIDTVAGAVGNNYWKEPCYWDSALRNANVSLCLQHGMAHAAYGHPMAWMDEIVKL